MLAPAKIRSPSQSNGTPTGFSGPGRTALLTVYHTNGTDAFFSGRFMATLHAVIDENFNGGVRQIGDDITREGWLL